MSPLARPPLTLALAALLAGARAADVLSKPELLNDECTYLELGPGPGGRPVKSVKSEKTIYPETNAIIEPDNNCEAGHRLYTTKIAACTLNGNSFSSPTLEPVDNLDPQSDVQLTCRVWPRGCPRCPDGTEVEYTQICDAEPEGRRKLS